MKFPLEALPCAINQHVFLLKIPFFSRRQEAETGEREKAILATLGLGFPWGNRTLLENKCFVWRGKKSPQLSWDLTPGSWSFSVPAMLSFSFCFAVLESPSDQSPSSSTYTHILFCSVCVPLCSVGIKNFYFAGREECQWLCARWIQNLLTGGACFKYKHSIILSPRITFFFFFLACTWNSWRESLGTLIWAHYSELL